MTHPTTALPALAPLTPVDAAEGTPVKRAFWFAAGAGAGVYAMTKARRVAETFTPEGLADRLAGVSVGLRLFGDEVRAGHGREGKRRARAPRRALTWDTGPARRRARTSRHDRSTRTAHELDATREGTH